MTTSLSKFATALVAATCLGGCVSIESITPEPAVPGELVRLHLSNVIGPMSVEPGAKVSFEGEKMSLDPDTAAVVGFTIPEDTPPGTYTVRVTDGVGVLEVITIVPLLRRRSDSATLEVAAP